MAVNESGWIGILLLVFCGLLSNITANLLGEAMFHMEGLREYVFVFWYHGCCLRTKFSSSDTFRPD